MSGDKHYLNEAADAIAEKLPDHHGFILLAVPFAGGDQRVKYVSNLERESAVKVLKEWMFHAGHEEGWMKHL